MKTIYFAELPSRQCRSRSTHSIMIHALVPQNGRKIDVRSKLTPIWEGIFPSDGSFPFGSMIWTSKIDDDHRYTQ